LYWFKFVKKSAGPTTGKTGQRDGLIYDLDDLGEPGLD